MDETLARVALDISGRPFLVWKSDFTQEKLGEWDTELIEHWFHSVAQPGGITLHVQLLYGQNNHHVAKRSSRASPGRCVRRSSSTHARAGRSQHQGRSVGPMAVALIDYGAGNLHSVHNALARRARGGRGRPRSVTSVPRDVADRRIVLPGVGSFGRA